MAGPIAVPPAATGPHWPPASFASARASDLNSPSSTSSMMSPREGRLSPRTGSRSQRMSFGSSSLTILSVPTNTPINARSPIAPQQAPKSNNENTAPSPTRPRRQSLSLSFGAAQPSPTSAHHAEADHAPSAAAASQPSASRGAAPADNNVQIHLIADAEILLPFLDRPAEVRELLFDTPANASLTSRLCRTFGGDPERPQLTGVSDEWSTLLGLLCDTHREDVDDNAWLVKLRSTIKPRSHELWALTQRCLAADGIKINDEADMPSQSSFDTWAAFDLDDNAVDDEDSDDHAGWFASSSRDHRDDDLQQPSAVEIQAVHALPTSYHNTPAGQLHQECLSSRNADDVCRALSPFSDTDFGAHLNDPVLPAERISPGMFPMSHPKDDPYISLCETHSLMDIQEEPSVEKDGQDVPRHEFSLRSPLVGQGRRRRSSTNISSPIHRPDELEEFMHNTSGRFAGLRLCTGGQDHRSRRSVGSASHSRTSSSSSLNMAGSEPSMDNALDSSSQPQGVKGDTHQGVTFSRHRRLSNLILTPASPPQGPSYPAQPLSSADVNASAAQQTWPRSTGFPCRDSPSSSAAIGSQPSQPSLARRMGDHIDASPFKRHRRATSAGFAPESLSQPTEGKRLEQRRRLSFARSFAELAITPPQARVQPSPGRPAERARAVSVPSCPAEEAVACEATGAPKKASLGLMRDGRTRHPSAGHRAGSPSRAAFRASLGLSPSESAFDIAGGRSMTQVTSPDSGGSSPEGRRSPHSVSPRTVALPEESASGAATPLGDTATPMPTVPGLGTSYFGPKSQEFGAPLSRQGSSPSDGQQRNGSLVVGGGLGLRHAPPPHRLGPTPPSPHTLMRNPRAARRPGGFASLAQEFEHSRRARAMSSGSAFSDAGMSINSEALGSSEASTIDDGWNRLSPGHAPESSLVTDKFPERHPVGLTSMPLSSPPPPPPQPLSRASDNAERERTPPSSHHQRDTWGSSPTGSDAESHTDSLGLGNFSPDSSMAALSPTSPASSFASMSPEPEHKAAAAMPSMHTVLDTPPVTRARSTSQSQGGHPPETIIFPIPPGRGFSRPKELRNVLSDPTHAPVLAQCEETCGPGQFAQAKLLLCSAERRELPDRALLERVAQAFGLVDHHSHSSSSTHPSPSPSSRTREEQDRIDDMLCEESYPLKWKAFARFCEVLCIAPQDIAEARKRCGPLPGSGSGSQHGVDA